MGGFQHEKHPPGKKAAGESCDGGGDQVVQLLTQFVTNPGNSLTP
jgi:hypothetical protein